MTVPPVVPGTPEGRLPDPDYDPTPEQASGQVSRRITSKDLAQIAELLTERSKQAATVSGGPGASGEPNMRESLLNDSKTLFSGAGGLIIFYIVAVYLAVRGSFFCVFFFAMAFTYSALLAGMLANRFRLASGAFIVVGAVMIGWALVAVSFGAYHYALAVAAYGIWALVTTASSWYGEGRFRDSVFTILAHGLALMGFFLVDAGWIVDSPAAGLSIAASLILGCLVLRDHRSRRAK